MNEEATRQAIIKMAHQGMDRGTIIRSLVSQGYDTSDVERVFNELYYAGLLTRDKATALEQAGIKSVKDLLMQKVPGAAASISKSTRIRIWVQTHRRSAYAVMAGILSLVAAVIGGIYAYTTADAVVVNRAFLGFVQMPVVSYEMSTTTFMLPGNNQVTVSLNGVMSLNPIPQATMELFMQKNNLTPWRITLIHGQNDVMYAYITQGPLDYPFLYNRWIQFSTAPSEVQLWRVFGFPDYLLSLEIFKSFTQTDPLHIMREFVSTQKVYTNLSAVQSPVISKWCDHAYSVLFEKNNLSSLLRSLLGLDTYTAAVSQDPWGICIQQGTISSVAIPVAALGGVPTPLMVSFHVPTTTPAFSVDAITTPLATVVQWAQERVPGMIVP